MRKSLIVITVVFWIIMIGFTIGVTTVMPFGWARWQWLFLVLLLLYWRFEVGRWPWQGPPKDSE